MRKLRERKSHLFDTYCKVNNELNGTIPEEVKVLTLMQQLDLSQNYLSGVIPTGLEGLSANLQTLRVARNNMRGRISEGLGELTSLTELQVRYHLERDAFVSNGK